MISIRRTCRPMYIHTLHILCLKKDIDPVLMGRLTIVVSHKMQICTHFENVIQSDNSILVKQECSEWCCCLKYPLHLSKSFLFHSFFFSRFEEMSTQVTQVGLSTLSSKLNDNMTVSKSIIANDEHMINCVKIEMQIIYLLFGQMYRSQTIFVLCIIHTICEEFCSEQFVQVVFLRSTV